MRLLRALAVVLGAAGAIFVCSGCMRAVSTPDAWPCRSNDDCEPNEDCIVSAPDEDHDALGECRPREVDKVTCAQGDGGRSSAAEDCSAGAGAEAAGGNDATP